MSVYPLATETWDAEERALFEEIVARGRFTMGPEVSAFEAEFARMFGSRHAVMVNSGSSANLLGVAATVYHPNGLLKPGDTVLVPAVGWSTSYFPFHQLGLHLRFVDVCASTLNLDPTLLEAALTPETRAVLAINLLGNPCDFEALSAFCAAHGLLLLEDNCESMGARFQGRNTGTFGKWGSFSTFFSHHISTMEGGMVVTDDEALYHTMLSMRAHGWIREQPQHSHLLEQHMDEFLRPFHFVLPGYNLRPLELSGAIGRKQLHKLPAMLVERRRNARRFQELLVEFPGLFGQEETGESSWFGFSLLLQGPYAGRRAELARVLDNAQIECRPIVTGNFLRNPVMRHLNHSVGSKMPAADQIHTSGLFIGNHPYPIEQELEQLRGALRSFTGQR